MESSSIYVYIAKGNFFFSNFRDFNSLAVVFKVVGSVLAPDEKRLVPLIGLAHLLKFIGSFKKFFLDLYA